jgi:hypothetical protein
MAEEIWMPMDQAIDLLGQEDFDLLASLGVITGTREKGVTVVDRRAVLRAASVQKRDKGPMSRVPTRYDPTLDPIQIGDKVIARERLLDDNGDLLAKPGQRLVVMGRDGPLFLLANGRGGRGRAGGHKLRKGYQNQADLETNDSTILPGAGYYSTEFADDEDEVPEDADDDEDDEELVESDDEALDDEVDELEPAEKTLSPELEQEYRDFLRFVWQRTGLTIEELRARAGSE